MTRHLEEIEKGTRFPFGRNWVRFMSVLDKDRIAAAEASLATVLGFRDLAGKSFLDIGSGSGLMSLAACRLGARVTSFDYDPESVACTESLRRMHFAEGDWQIATGSVLDPNFMKSLGVFDIVYSWGVLHHTGDMWRAMELASSLPAQNGGLLVLAIYNDQGSVSAIWKVIKKMYCSSLIGKILVISLVVPYFCISHFFKDTLRLRNPFRRYIIYRNNRGMSVIHDWLDWLGGYPFDVAKPEEIHDFAASKGFSLIRMRTTNHLGNNWFVFKRMSHDARPSTQ